MAAHEPLLNAGLAASLGNPSCVFVTGGPREYLPGINCVANQLQAVRSKHPLLVLVDAEEEAYMRQRVTHATVAAWRHFPVPQSGTFRKAEGWKYRARYAMDKLNLFGLPFPRAVWLDADVFVRTNVDELCELPPSVTLATTLNVGGKVRPTACWPHRTRCENRSCPREYDLENDAQRSYLLRRPSELQPPMERCPYIVQSGVMSLVPLPPPQFAARVVAPVGRGEVLSYDGGDQGAINTLLYDGRHAVWRDGLARLHPAYNVLARTQKHSARSMGGIPPKLVHYTRESRPWQHRIDPSDANGSEWLRACAASVCTAEDATAPADAAAAAATAAVPLSGVGKLARGGKRAGSKDASAVLKARMGLAAGWHEYCRGRRVP